MNLLYWMGWLFRKSKRELPAAKHYLWYYVMAGILTVVIFHFTGNQAGSYSSYGAYYYVHTGEAAIYRQQYLQRVEKIRQSDASAPENVSMAMWYDKAQIYVKTETD